MYITTTVERNDEQVEIEVELSYRRGLPPSWEHPGDPDEIEIIDIYSDIPIELTAEEEKKVMALAYLKAEKDNSDQEYES